MSNVLRRLDRAVLIDGLVSLSVVVLFTWWWHQFRLGALVYGLLVGVALLWRRHRPIAVLGVVALLSALAGQIEVGGSMMSEGMPLVAMAVALHAVIAHSASLLNGVGCAAAVVVGAAVWLETRHINGVPDRTLDTDGFVDAVAHNLMFGAVVAAAALGVRVLRVQQVSEAERQGVAERERAQQARVGVAEERVRIARELHDIVAHSLSVIVLQANGGRYAFDHDPARAREALRTIGATGSDALDEIRQLVVILRGDGDDEAGRDRAVASVVERARDAGMAVELITDGDPAAVPGGVALAVYRIVQESLTNILKHAGPAPAATVRVAYHPAAVDLEITDAGRGGPPRPGGGHGLVGMRERATLYGGSFDAGPVLGGGWRVRARIPLPAEAVPA